MGGQRFSDVERYHFGFDSNTCILLNNVYLPEDL